jgi:phage/plasmid-like protein (TIGR03299 family)
MSHEIESMFSVGELPWHGLGHVLEAAPSCAEALVLAGLNWGVELRPLATTVADAGVSIAVESHRAVMRMDTGAVLGVVGEDFRPFANADAFAFFEPLVGEGLITLETAGSLRAGRRVWIMAKVVPAGSAEIVAGDPVDPYLLMCHGHDGSLAMRVGFNPVRVVCSNTLRMALDDGEGLFTLRHTSGLSSGLVSIREAIAEQVRIYQGSVEAWQFLASRRCEAGDFETFLLSVFRGEEATPRTGARLLEAVRPLMAEGKGNDLPGVRGTWWAAYNAITEWLTHHRGSAAGTVAERAERRFDALHFGDARKLGARALTLALEAAHRSGSMVAPPMLALPPGIDDEPEGLDIGAAIDAMVIEA